MTENVGKTRPDHEPTQIISPDRESLVQAVIQVFVELVTVQRYTDMPGWLDYDLTVSQVRTIYLLVARERLTISEIAHLLGMGKPAASILVQQLVDQGLVKRSEDSLDRRRSWARLTPRGKELVNGRREQREAQFKVWLRQMDEEDLVGLLKGISVLNGLIHKAQP